MRLRDATEQDLADVCALIHELAVYERLEEEVVLEPPVVASHLFGADPVAHVILADADDGAIAGFALWFRTFSTFLGRPGIWLEDLFVRPPYRRRGIATALLHELRLRTPGRVEWAVLDWNRPAIDMYERLGARPVAGWTRYRWGPGDTKS